jgi:hypothetical protein
VLPVQHIEFFEAAVEFKDDKDQHKNADHDCHASHINGEVEHMSILIVLELYDKKRL